MGKYEKIDTGGSDSEERHRKCFTLLMYKWMNYWNHGNGWIIHDLIWWYDLYLWCEYNYIDTGAISKHVVEGCIK